MRYFLIRNCLLAVFIGCMTTSSAWAATLTIVLNGSGHGTIIGHNMLCPDLCERNFASPVSITLAAMSPETLSSADLDQFQVQEDPTQFSLLAIPYADVEFGGWSINGMAIHEPFVLEQDTILMATFQKVGIPDESGFQVTWYSDNMLVEVTVALDEMHLVPQYVKSWYDEHPEEFQALLHEVRQHFHPYAEIVDYYSHEIAFKSPVPLEKSAWLASYAALRRLPIIRFVPVYLYYYYPDRSQYTFPLGEISVRYPTYFTTEDIQQVELDFGLGQGEPWTGVNQTFYYYDIEDPLQSLEIANALQASGRVVYVSPSIYQEIAPTN